MKNNIIYCGDNKNILRDNILDESIDLVYIDPPFFSNRKYETIWEDGSELRSFEDRWKGGIKHYIDWMKVRLIECHRVLKSTGSFFLHCDFHAGHYLKVLLDEIFGYNNFQNEIVWCYRGAAVSSSRYPRKHDTLLYYSKSDTFTFNILYENHTDAQLKRYNTLDEDGNRWANMKGKIRKLGPGVRLMDWWYIPQIPNNSKERLGYPTQKPVELLERIITSSSNKTDVILDAFCGCGTTLEVAQKLNRQWIGIDISPNACKLMVKRIQKLGINITDNDIIGMPRTIEELNDMKWEIFQDWVCEKMLATSSVRKVGDMGIDGIMRDGTLIQVKQSKSVGRNVVDNFETAIRREKKEKGIIVAFSFSKGAYEEVARCKEDGLMIVLKEVSEFL